jgi:transcriptional regulator with XRE-family HTH domain
MSPFSVWLKNYRLSRGLKQIELAERLGYEPSYLSALERSQKGPPRQDFVRRLIRGLKLSEHEQTELARALSDSCRQVSLPARSSIEEYAFLARLRPQLGSLHPLQLKLLDLVLQIPETFPNSQNVVPAGTCRTERQEAPRM